MRFIPVLWLAFVTAISMMPLRLKYRAGTTGALHIPGHFLIFFITAILLCRTAPTPALRLLRWTGVCCFALAMEILEWVTYHNTMEWRDVVVDFVGAAIGVAVLSLFPTTTPHVQDSEMSESRSQT
jgi:hypothetical protein